MSRSIQPQLNSVRQQAIAQYQELLATKQASADLKQIVPAAVHGQVDTLFVAADGKCWGKCWAQNNTVRVANNPTPDNLDLLNFAVKKIIAIVVALVEGSLVIILFKVNLPLP